MKILNTLLVLFLTVNSTLTNEIDNLETNQDVEKFLVEKVDRDWENGAVFEPQEKEDTSAFGKGKFFKLDLDNNGLTDLVINGKYLFAITDGGKGKYQSSCIDRGTFLLKRYTLRNIVYEGKTPLLVIGGYNGINLQRDKEKEVETDTLVFKFDDFYEYNSNPKPLPVREIRFSTSQCFGTCPVFELTIKPDGAAEYHAIQYCGKRGSFKTVLDTVILHKLLETIDYIEWASLKDEYSVNWTDDQTATLEIIFSNGQTKKISDYGMIGTFGLQHLYEQLFAIRKTQKWRR